MGDLWLHLQVKEGLRADARESLTLVHGGVE